MGFGWLFVQWGGTLYLCFLVRTNGLRFLDIIVTRIISILGRYGLFCFDFQLGEVLPCSTELDILLVYLEFAGQFCRVERLFLL